MFTFFRSLWGTDRGLTSLCALAFFAMFVVHPFAGEHAAIQLLLPLVSGLIIVTGMCVVSASVTLRVVAVFFASVGLFVRWTQPLTQYVCVIDSAVSVAFIGTFVSLLLKAVFRSGAVTMHRVLGAVTIYLLLGMLWGQLYLTIELMFPGSFNLPSATADMYLLGSQLVYFSFTTLTTAGYGDIVPLSPLARSFANLEALVGQLYPAVLLARLISMEVYFHQKKVEMNLSKE